ncbi:MAG: lysophospholipid acyltransferase family protein [Clostridiales bacterium]
MFRTIVWYIYFWLYLIKLIPKYYKINRILKNGNIKEHDKIVHSMASKWSQSLLKLAGAKIKVIGVENIPVNKSVLFVSNHQGSFDIPILLGCIDKPKSFVAKIEMLKMPLINKWMKHMNCVFLDRKDIRQSLRVMNEASKYLKNGYSMIVFPEGTRSKGKKMGEFKAGSLKIASKAKVPIIPITVKGSYKLLEQNGFKIKPADVEVVISEPIETLNLNKTEFNLLNEKVYSIIKSKL